MTTIDGLIAEVAARHFGAFARREVRDRADRHALQRRERAGVIEGLSRNVFRVCGAPRSDQQRVAAATLDLDGSIAAGLTAAWVWQIPGFPLRRVEIAAPREADDHSVLAVVRQPRLWLPEHITERHGIPVMSLAWTIYTLAGQLPYPRLLWVVDRVGNESQAVLTQLHDMFPMLAESGRNGIAAMRAALEENPPGVRPPGSGYERRFLQITHDAGITGLRRQVDVGGHEWIGRVDFRCELSGVIFEIDSELHHTSPADVAADAKRDEAMFAAGVPEVVRIWTECLWPRPHEAIALVRAARARHPRAA